MSPTENWFGKGRIDQGICHGMNPVINNAASKIEAIGENPKSELSPLSIIILELRSWAK